MNATHKIDLDLIRREPTPRLAMKTGDTCTRTLQISLFHDGTPWPVPQGASFLVRYRKADGTMGLYDTMPYDDAPAVTAQDNQLTVSLAPQVLTCPGLTRCDVVMILGVQALATFDIHLAVEQGPVSDGDLESQDYYRVASLAQINAALAQIDLSIAFLNTALGQRVQTVNGMGPDSSGNVEVEAGSALTVDSTLSQTSQNPVQNKVVTAAVQAALSKSGGTMTGNLNMGGNAVQNVTVVNFQSGGVAIGYDPTEKVLMVRDQIHNQVGRLQVGTPTADADAATKAYVDGQASLPAVTAGDNGKILRVVSGVWQPVALTDAEEVSY